MRENKPTREHWLRTAEALDAVNSLEMESDQLAKLEKDLHHWKWVLIALHMGLQGYMVLALRGSDSLSVLSDNCAKQWLDARNRKRKILPPRHLDWFMNLYDKLKKPDLMKTLATSQIFSPQGSQDESVKMLCHLRNEFIHFTPKGWSIPITDLTQVVMDCVDIIDFLAFKCGNVLWYDDKLEARTKELIHQIRLQLQKMN